MQMGLHMNIRAFLDSLPEEVKQFSYKKDYLVIRKQEAEQVSAPRVRVPIRDVEDRFVQESSSNIPVRIYTPEGEGPFPLLVFLHGGGWVLGNLETEDDVCRLLALETGCKVISVDYRLAPEHPFPAGLKDSLAAVEWAANHAAELGGDPGKIFIAGSSAGGNLAAAVTLLIRDLGGPALSGQILIYPATEAHRHGNPLYTSYDECSEYGLSSRQVSELWELYLPDPQLSESPYASPCKATDLRRLPPALVVTCGHDTLRDEGLAYAERMSQAGNQVRTKHYEPMNHAFNVFFPDLDESEDLYKEIRAFLQNL